MFERDGNILLQRRFNTGWQDGNYSFVSGHIEDNEQVLDAAIREAKEEIGVKLHKDTLKVIHVMHNKTDSNYINFFIKVNAWEGEPAIMEPDKSDDLSWYPVDSLPENLLYFLKDFFVLVEKKEIFSVFGF